MHTWFVQSQRSLNSKSLLTEHRTENPLLAEDYRIHSAPNKAIYINDENAFLKKFQVYFYQTFNSSTLTYTSFFEIHRLLKKFKMRKIHHRSSCLLSQGEQESQINVNLTLFHRLLNQIYIILLSWFGQCDIILTFLFTWIFAIQSSEFHLWKYFYKSTTLWTYSRHFCALRGTEQSIFLAVPRNITDGC